MSGRLEIGSLLAACGAALLLVSLFVDWYEPGVSAFTAFETLDLLLAALAVAAVVAAIGSALGAVVVPGLAGALPALSGVALLIVVSQAINHPPSAVGADALTGQWLALAGTALMAVGATLGVARISLALDFSPRGGDRSAAPDAQQGGRARPAPAPAAAGPGAPEEVAAAEEARVAEPEVKDELYPETERTQPIGVDDPETSRLDRPR